MLLKSGSLTGSKLSGGGIKRAMPSHSVSEGSLPLLPPLGRSTQSVGDWQRSCSWRDKSEPDSGCSRATSVGTMKLRGASLAVLPALLTGLLPLAQAGALQATFTYPTQKGLKFYEQDTVQVSYQSNISNASLWVFCLEGDNGAILKTSMPTRACAPSICTSDSAFCRENHLEHGRRRRVAGDSHRLPDQLEHLLVQPARQRRRGPRGRQQCRIRPVRQPAQPDDARASRFGDDIGRDDIGRVDIGCFDAEPHAHDCVDVDGPSSDGQ